MAYPLTNSLMPSHMVGHQLLQFHLDCQLVSWFKNFVHEGTCVSDVQRGECSQYDCRVVVHKLWNSL